MEGEPKPARQGRPYALNAAPTVPTRLVARPRLMGILDRATDTPLTLVIAPAGSGKTVMLAEWVHDREAARDSLDVRWVAAREHHKLMAATLLAAGVSQAAVRRLVRDSADDLALQADAIELLRGATSSGHAPTVVVIDDAHQLPQRAFRFLGRVLTGAPDSVRLVVLTRRDLPLPLVALDLAGSVQTLRSGQLRFQGDEVKELVVAHAPAASKADIQELRDHTQGGQLP